MPKRPHPSALFFLILPYGASFGYVSVALPSIAAHRGIPVQAIGGIIALAFAPHAWKFLWAPVVDTTLTRVRWYLIALTLVVFGTVASASMPVRADALGPLAAVVLASQIGLTLMGMACEWLIGHLFDEGSKGRASGWFQAGQWFGLGAGGGLALWLSERMPGWLVGVVMGTMMIGCGFALKTLPALPRENRPLGAAMRALFVDLRTIATSRVGLTGLLICLSPVGAGAASNYWSAIADDWGASTDLVALVNGTLGGVIAAIGSMAGGWLGDRFNRRLLYALAGALTALTAVAMALGPRTPFAFGAFVLIYGFCNGITFAAFMAFVMETIGKGAVATKYNIFASLMNLAIIYMTRVDGAAHTRHGSSGLLLTDAAWTAGGIVLLLIMMAIVRKPVRATA